MAAVVVVLVWSTFGTELSPWRLLTGLAASGRFIAEFFPPDFTRGSEYLNSMFETIKMAVWGTALAFIAAVPLSFWAATNTTPHSLVYQFTRRMSDVFRGLNEFVLAMVFVAALGLGPFPGILALAVSTTGTLIKLFSEAIELVDVGQVEAVKASGAGPLQVLTHAYWPQIVPTVLSMTLYRFEANVRGATVLGLVGAGGIGLYVTEAIRGFNFQAAGAILIVILVAVFLVDFLSAKVRERLS
jgi:phosphonate transport system permease protein